MSQKNKNTNPFLASRKTRALFHSDDAETKGIRNPATPQAVIHLSYNADVQAITERGENNGGKGDKIVSVKLEDQNFNLGDFLLSFKNDLVNSGKRAPKVFVALNGVPTDKYENNEDMENDIAVVAICYQEKRFASSFHPGVKDQLMVGGQPAGSHAVIYKSGDGSDIIYGKTYTLKVPFFDKSLGILPSTKEYLMKNKYSNSDAITRLTPVMEEYDPSKVQNIVARIYRLLSVDLAQSKSKYIPMNRHFDPSMYNSIGMSRTDKMAVSHLMVYVAVFIAMARVLKKRRILSIYTPSKRIEQDAMEQMRKELDRVNGDNEGECQDFVNRWKNTFGNLSKFQKTDVSKCKGMTFAEYDKLNPFSIERSPFEEFDRYTTKEEKIESHNEDLWLACRLGLVTNKGNPSTRDGGANPEWLSDFIHTFYNDMIPETTKAGQYRKTVYSTSAPFSTNKHGATPGYQSVEKQFERAMKEAPHQQQQATNVIYHQTVASAKVVALESGKSGDAGQVLLKLF